MRNERLQEFNNLKSPKTNQRTTGKHKKVFLILMNTKLFKLKFDKMWCKDFVDLKNYSFGFTHFFFKFYHVLNERANEIKSFFRFSILQLRSRL